MRIALLQIHIAVFIWGFTGVLGKAILLDEITLVWWRLLLTSLCLLVFNSPLNKLINSNTKTDLALLNNPINTKACFFLSLPGVFLALHWVCFYGSIKYANVSVSLICLSSSALFAAILEPLFFRQKIKYKELIYGSLTIIGIFIIYNSHLKFSKGFYYGIMASILTVIAALYNKKVVQTYNAHLVLKWQMLSAFITICIVYLIQIIALNNIVIPNWVDLLYLLILSIICTILTFILYNLALQKISVFTSNLVLTLEPIYGIALAFIWFKEYKEISNYFYIGFIIILATVALHTYSTLKNKNQ